VTPTPNPFRQTLSKQDIARVRKRKVERLPVLMSVIKQMMMESAAALRNMPPGEQVVFAVSLFHLNWEDTDGLPAQIVMRAPRQQLLARAVADAAIQVEQH
jgi:hypothetical protein